MNTDIFIVITAVLAFFVFLVFHVIIFRHIKKRDAVRWFLITLIAVGTVLGFFAPYISVVLYILMTGAYFMGVFGLLATSVRIRLLTEIAEAGEKGLSLKQLEKRYNAAGVVRERLARFVSSGDIAYANGYYVGKKGITFFVLPALVLHLMKFFYGTHGEKK